MRQHQRTEKQQLDRSTTIGEEIFQRFTKASLCQNPPTSLQKNNNNNNNK